MRGLEQWQIDTPAPMERSFGFFWHPYRVDLWFLPANNSDKSNLDLLWSSGAHLGD